MELAGIGFNQHAEQGAELVAGQGVDGPARGNREGADVLEDLPHGGICDSHRVF